MDEVISINYVDISLLFVKIIIEKIKKCKLLVKFDELFLKY